MLLYIVLLHDKLLLISGGDLHLQQCASQHVNVARQPTEQQMLSITSMWLCLLKAGAAVAFDQGARP